ncbi:platelet-activating factor acetylhydrolase [Aplysia californica]|uniref:1-alkyl-2-acetylglycerophosphocholine esterase n=1 Tax=Aplysia californica TaxID=6500 RepID=A0ABM1AAB9_APLCA|nr:platelet-activating factor acetylhydrolase [Aplysia californica]
MLCALSQFLDRNANLADSKEEDSASKGSNSSRPGTPDQGREKSSDGVTSDEEGGVPKHNRRHLPLPSGPHTVGCVDIMCDVADHGTFFRLYYPTTKTDIHKHYKQWPLWLPRKQYAHGYMIFLKKRKIFGRLAHLIGGDVHVPVLWQAPLLKSEDKFPVLIVTHGIGGNRTTLSTYCTELASHGFVVAAVEHRDGSASMTLCLQEQLSISIKDCNDDDDDDDSVVSDDSPGPNRRGRHKRYRRSPHSMQRSDSGNNNTTTINNNNDDKADGCDVVSLSGERPTSGVQFYLNEGKENRDSEGGRGSRVQQRRNNRKRSLRHNHSCSEEWRPFEHVEVWDDFDYRNGQMYRRADEISDLLDELISMNEGNHINNALGLAFKTTHFKNRLDFSRVAVVGHSFGCASVLGTLATDNRFKVGLALDGWMHPVDSWVYSSTRQPVMFLNMESFQWEKNVARMIKFQESNPEADRPMLTLMGGCHQSVSDFQFIMPQLVGRFLDVCHTLRPDVCMSTCVTASLAFLYKHLSLPLEPKHKVILENRHPNLISGTNVDLTIPDDGPTPP